MAQGIKIKLRRQIGARKRQKDDFSVRIWTGLTLCPVDSVPYPESLDGYAQYPETVITPIKFPPPGALPSGALGYPRMLPQVFSVNDNHTKTSTRGRMNAKKAVLLKSNPMEAPSRLLPPRSKKRPAASEWTWEEKAEAVLTLLSKKYRRHVFQHTNGRVGYMDDMMRFVPVDAPQPISKESRPDKINVFKHADGRVGYLDNDGNFIHFDGQYLHMPGSPK